MSTGVLGISPFASRTLLFQTVFLPRGLVSACPIQGVPNDDSNQQQNKPSPEPPFQVSSIDARKFLQPTRFEHRSISLEGDIALLAVTFRCPDLNRNHLVAPRARRSRAVIRHSLRHLEVLSSDGLWSTRLIIRVSRKILRAISQRH